jgi:hypothetical protein
MLTFRSFTLSINSIMVIGYYLLKSTREADTCLQQITTTLL